MFKPTHALLISLFLTVHCIYAQSVSTFYVNSNIGSDHNTGRSPEAAWASLEKVNSHTFQPGDKILFKSGTSYMGQLKPSGMGNSVYPIIIDQYGDGTKPLLEAQGQYQATIYLYNLAYWEVNNLEITNTGPDREGGRRGVIIEAENFGESKHIYLKSLDIHHVNGSLVKQNGGGSAILWKNGGDSLKTRFVDLKIENCHLYDCGRNGINSRGYTNRDEWYPSLGVVIRKNLLERIPGDGIVPIGCDGALIEYNVMRDCPPTLPDGEAAAGIWPWSSDNTLIQHNEVSDHNAPWDAQGFDSDWNCKNTIIQYNYSHNNAGGFLLICNNGESIGTPQNAGTQNTIVRYNVSVNDGYRAKPTQQKGYFSPTFHISGPCENSQIYNNVIYVPAKPNRQIDKTIVYMDNWGGPWPENTFFANNIFYVQDSADFIWGKSIDHTFQNNVYYGSFDQLPEDSNPIFEDPRFVRDNARPNGISSLNGFQLEEDSPIISRGINVVDQPIVDFYGNKVLPNQKPAIGIHERN